jgi:tetratricopeptide (TPR) repeat protein
MERDKLLERYEALGEERDFLEAKRLYERAIAEAPDPQVLYEYGYLLECHGRNEIRHAVVQYKRAIDLDPSLDKPRYQLIWAQASMAETELAIALYKQRLAQSPTEVREHRFLANAYLVAREYGEAARVIEAGLEVAPGDRMLLETRGQVRAATGDAEGALDDWRRAVDLDNNIGPIYSSALLLEREGRLQDAAAAWQSVIDWCELHDAPLTAEWPRRELARLRAVPAGSPERQ